MTTAPRGIRQNLNWRIISFFHHLLESDHAWAERRFQLLALAAAVFFLMGRAAEPIQTPALVQPYLATIPAQAAKAIELLLSLFYFQSLRHLLPPLVGGALAVLLASNYVRDLFNLPDLTTGRRYLTASMFGWDYPSISIKGGRYEVAEKSKLGLAQAEKAETNPIPIIGGPGYVNIEPGNAALFERAGGPSQVAGAGKHFIRRIETLREVVDLRDQFRTQDEVKALTKDGILVRVRNVQAGFRVRASERARSKEEIYPFAVQAIKTIAYGKTVSPKGPSLWTNGPPGKVAGIIRDYISRNVLDELIARPEKPAEKTDKDQGAEKKDVPLLPAPDKPMESKGTALAIRPDTQVETKEAASPSPPESSEKKKEDLDPREQIKAFILSKEMRKDFTNMGVELFWVSLGEIETPEDVLDQRIRAWQADWQRQVLISKSRGEAYEVRVKEYARIQGLIDFIEKLVEDVPLNIADPLRDRAIVHHFIKVINMVAKSLAPEDRGDGKRDKKPSKSGLKIIVDESGELFLLDG